jgi:hypothetical protein
VIPSAAAAARPQRHKSLHRLGLCTAHELEDYVTATRPRNHSTSAGECRVHVQQPAACLRGACVSHFKVVVGCRIFSGRCSSRQSIYAVGPNKNNSTAHVLPAFLQQEIVKPFQNGTYQRRCAPADDIAERAHYDCGWTCRRRNRVWEMGPCSLPKRSHLTNRR